MVEMKRFRENDQNTGIVDALLLLSRGGGDEVPGTSHDRNHKRVFECKTCSKQFSSFQALGGHRASHKKSRLADGDMGRARNSKPKAHECSICGLEFATGQALGGHMRRHRADNYGFGHVGQKAIGERVALWDLNLPASGNDVEHRDLGLGLGLGLELELGLGVHYVHKTTPLMVDCFR